MEMYLDFWLWRNYWIILNYFLRFHLTNKSLAWCPEKQKVMCFVYVNVYGYKCIWILFHLCLKKSTILLISDFHLASCVLGFVPLFSGGLAQSQPLSVSVSVACRYQKVFLSTFAPKQLLMNHLANLNLAGIQTVPVSGPVRLEHFPSSFWTEGFHFQPVCLLGPVLLLTTRPVGLILLLFCAEDLIKNPNAAAYLLLVPWLCFDDILTCF